MGGWRPVRNDRGINIPNSSEFLNVLFVIPVAKPWQISVCAGLACVLSRRLPVHLQDAAAGSSDHAADEIDVVDLDGSRGRLVRLVDTLKAGTNQTFCFADHARGGFDLLCWNAGNRGT